MAEDCSRVAFEAVRDDPEALARLSRVLVDDITERLQPTLIELMKKVVADLNAAGPDLHLYFAPADGEISYRDRGPADDRSAGLRVAHDSIVSVGFGDFDPE